MRLLMRYSSASARALRFLLDRPAMTKDATSEAGYRLHSCERGGGKGGGARA
jgi:hypothetical protein